MGTARTGRTVSRPPRRRTTRASELVRGNRLGELVATDSQWAVDALADSFWQLLMLHGAIGTRFEPELLSYEAPTYFGMLTAAYARQD